ncbi:MAG TPA: FtsQ-type POTRA domain-containing protein [Nitrospirales bacterium]|nr:FtsQ-type POTRA domain-containing protein [Nitrospirales bacterium]
MKVPSTASRVRRVVIGCVLACLLAGIVVGGRQVIQWADEWTEIQQISVVGLDRVSRDEILTRLALPPQTGLFSVDPEELSARLNAHPWISSVTFERVFPHSLVIQVTERRPAAVFGSPTEPYYLDAEGYLLPKGKKPEGTTLPIVEGVTAKFITQHEEEGHRRAKEGIHIAELLAQKFSGRPRVDVSQPHTTIVDLPDIRFHFGREVEDQWQRFLVLYPTVKDKIEGRSQEVDLRFAQKVIFRKRTL